MVHIIMSVNVFSAGHCGESTKPLSPLALKCCSVQPMVVGVLWIPRPSGCDRLLVYDKPTDVYGNRLTGIVIGTYLYVCT